MKTNVERRFLSLFLKPVVKNSLDILENAETCLQAMPDPSWSLHGANGLANPT